MATHLASFVSLKQRRLQQGFKLFEFGVVAAVLAIMATVLLQRLWFYQDQAEQVSVQQVASNVRAALKIKVAQGSLPGKMVDLTMLPEQNPLDWLTEKPANYLGELNAPRDQDVISGNWYFDLSDHCLVYLLNKRGSFGSAQLKRLKFKVKLLRLPKNPVKPTGTTEPDGVAFEQVNG
jgi:general secretion pathway protein G